MGLSTFMNTTKKYHWFPFYYLDWMTDLNVQMLSHAEKGLYLDMLCSCFNEDGLPTDNAMLQRLFKCDADDLKMVVTLFHERDGKLHNKKLDEVRDAQAEVSKQKSKAGKKSAQARKAKALMDSTPVEHVLNPVATERQQNPTSRVEESRVEEIKDNTPLVEEVWSNTPKMGKSRSSKAKLTKAIDKADANRDQIMMGLRAWLDSDDWKKDDGQFVQGIHIWVNDCKWENPPPKKNLYDQGKSLKL